MGTTPYGNKYLNKASIAKEDEFYTKLSDIEKELKHYKEHFKGKTIFCNCDDPETSGFWKYFELNFEDLEIRKLVATHFERDIPSYKLELTTDINGDGRINLKDIVKTRLVQNGDFRSPECIEILEEANIVITNPPFSLLREYIAQLIEYDKSFIIIGNMNSLHYKEVFPLIQQNKIWLGYNYGDMEFTVPSYYEPRKTRYREENGIKYRSLGNICWITNLDIKKRHEDLILYRSYNEADYPRYVNYDAIEIGRVSDIPEDYYGLMGVPDGFLQVYNPSQFEIVGYGRGDFIDDIGYVPEKFLEEYRANGGRGHITTGMKSLCYYDKNGKPKFPYSRIIIRRKR